MSVFQDLLRRELEGLCVLEEAQCRRLEGHYELLQAWNQRLNLTAVHSVEDIVVRHYCESLFVGRNLPQGPLRIVDVGSGAGFPGIPVGVLRPECTICLVESRRKKATFLREATRGWGNVQVFGGRAEELEPRFDWLISRAVKMEELPRLAPRFALLVGKGEGVGSAGAYRISGGRSVEVTSALKMPWGEHRRLVTGCFT